jgi:hypothetical protein
MAKLPPKPKKLSEKNMAAAHIPAEIISLIRQIRDPLTGKPPKISDFVGQAAREKAEFLIQNPLAPVNINR